MAAETSGRERSLLTLGQGAAKLGRGVATDEAEDKGTGCDGIATNGTEEWERRVAVKEAMMILFWQVGGIFEFAALLTIIDGLTGMRKAGIESVISGEETGAAGEPHPDLIADLVHLMLVEVACVQNLLGNKEGEGVDGCKTIVVSGDVLHLTIGSEADDGFLFLAGHTAWII